MFIDTTKGINDIINKNIDKLSSLKEVIDNKLYESAETFFIKFYDEEDEDRKVVAFKRDCDNIKKYLDSKVIHPSAVIIMTQHGLLPHPYIVIKSKNMEEVNGEINTAKVSVFDNGLIDFKYTYGYSKKE